MTSAKSLASPSHLACFAVLFPLSFGCASVESGEGTGMDGGTQQMNRDSSSRPDVAVSSESDAASEDCEEIVAVVRDFDVSHPDFEDSSADAVVMGLVMPDLDADGLPQYAHGEQSQGEIDNAASFDQWYRDVDGVNQRFEVPLPLSAAGQGRFVYENDFFFPIDGQGFGNSGQDQEQRDHNFHFTTELRTSFIYRGGETFTFRGDDDLWMFIDGKLAIDLGGTHQPAEQVVAMDSLGLTVGEKYAMEIFHAERHTSASNFRVETTIACFMKPILR